MIHLSTPSDTTAVVAGASASEPSERQRCLPFAVAVLAGAAWIVLALGGS